MKKEETRISDSDMMFFRIMRDKMQYYNEHPNIKPAISDQDMTRYLRISAILTRKQTSSHEKIEL